MPFLFVWRKDAEQPGQCKNGMDKPIPFFLAPSARCGDQGTS